MTLLPSVQARRLSRPSWRDARLLGGLALVLVSMLTGAWLLAFADDRSPVYAATAQLLPGAELQDSDLAVVSVRLDDAADSYVDASREVEPGTYLLRAVAAGELVPSAALGSARQAKDKAVSVPVDPAMSAALKVGTVVDVWVSRRKSDEASVQYGDPELLLEQAVVARVPSTSGGGLGLGVSATAVSVVVPADEVASVISSVDQEARITLVPAPGAGRDGS